MLTLTPCSCNRAISLRVGPLLCGPHFLSKTRLFPNSINPRAATRTSMSSTATPPFPRIFCHAKPNCPTSATGAGIFVCPSSTPRSLSTAWSTTSFLTAASVSILSGCASSSQSTFCATCSLNSHPATYRPSPSKHVPYAIVRFCTAP